jgi:carbonic anhydrase
MMSNRGYAAPPIGISTFSVSHAHTCADASCGHLPKFIPPVQKLVSDNDALQGLMHGYQRFRSGYYEVHKPLFEALAAKGQSPKVMTISCCDSRVDPAIMFDAAPGDMFMFRNVANIVPPYAPDVGFHGTSSALEFAVKYLEVQALIVMGHYMCGGVNALLRDDGRLESKTGEFISTWMSSAREARDKVLERFRRGEISQGDLQRECELQNTVLSSENLLSYPWIRQRVEEGKLTIHAWYFDFLHGRLEVFDKQSKTWFAALEMDAHHRPKDVQRNAQTQTGTTS